MAELLRAAPGNVEWPSFDSLFDSYTAGNRRNETGKDEQVFSDSMMGKPHCKPAEECGSIGRKG
jgi:hypothetical protein